MNYKNYQIEIKESKRAKCFKFRALIDGVDKADGRWVSAEAALEHAKKIVDERCPARPEPDKQGYGAYQHGGKWFTIKPVYIVAGQNLSYKYQLEGYVDAFRFGRGWYDLDKAIRAAKRKIEAGNLSHLIADNAVDLQKD